MWILRASHNVKVFVLSLMSGLLFWPVIGSAELYKWTDDQGNLHITDTLPPVTQKKSANTVAPVPRSASPKRATVRPPCLGDLKLRFIPYLVLISHSPASEEVPIQQPMVGLSPNQATLTSSWQVFDSTRMNAKAPVQRWKDEQGLDHFVDVLPRTRGAQRVAPKAEGVSASHLSTRAKERATVYLVTRHRRLNEAKAMNGWKPYQKTLRTLLVAVSFLAALIDSAGGWLPLQNSYDVL